MRKLNKNYTKKDCCFCPAAMRLNELKDMKIQMIEYKMKEILGYIKDDTEETERYEF